jgi:hypothetical protein
MIRNRCQPVHLKCHWPVMTIADENLTETIDMNSGSFIFGNLIPHFFLIFCIFYNCVSSLIANVTIFGIVHTDHVHISPPTSSLIFSLIFCIFYS